MSDSEDPQRSVFLLRRGLIWQLFAITILPLTLLTLVISFGSLALHQRAMRSLVGERDQRAIQTAAVALEEQLHHRESAMRSLALLSKGATQAELSEILSSSGYLLTDFDSGLTFFDRSGRLESATGDQEFWESVQAQIGPVIEDLLREGGSSTMISSRYSHPVSGERIILALAVSPDSSRIAMGASSASELVRHTLANSFASGDETSVVLLDTNQNVLYQNGSFSYPGGLTAHPGISEALAGESGVTYVQVGDSEHVVTYSPITPAGWAIVLEEPWESVDTPVLRTTQIAPLVLVPVLLLTLVALWFGLRQIVRPLRALESKAAQLAWGDFQAIEEPVGGITEIGRLQAELIHMARKVQAAQQSLHSYIGAITAGQEEERRRLARELHDDTIQSLIALKQRVHLAQLTMNGSSKEPLDEIVALTEQTIENVRRQTRALRPIYLEDLGLVTALEMLAQETGQSGNLSVEFHRQGTEKRFDPDVELALYRIAQEALNNVIKHAQTSRASLSLDFDPNRVVLQIIDNGKGFVVPNSPAEFAPSGHFGLLGLHERAELIGAQLEIFSSLGQGSRVTVTLPVSSLVRKNSTQGSAG